MITASLTAAAVGAVITMSVMETSGQAQRPARVGGKPNFSGIWQVANEANYDLEAHAARPGLITQKGVYPYDYARVPAAPVVALGAAGAVPGSLGVVQGDGKIPYTPAALALKNRNIENWIDRDPELKCYLPGIPRAMYMKDHPFEITQSTNKIHMAYSFTATARTIHLDKVEPPPDDTFMGHSVGRWDGDTLVTTVDHFNGRNWLSRAGDHTSDQLKLTEKFTQRSPDVMWYEVNIEDPKTYTRPWQIAMPIYKRAEPNAQLLEFRCIEFVEEFMYGSLRKTQLVKTWEGEMMRVDITRKVPPGDSFYDWYGGANVK
jgi:hypothetical protein